MAILPPYQAPSKHARLHIQSYPNKAWRTATKSSTCPEPCHPIKPYQSISGCLYHPIPVMATLPPPLSSTYPEPSVGEVQERSGTHSPDPSHRCTRTCSIKQWQVVSSSVNQGRVARPPRIQGMARSYKSCQAVSISVKQYQAVSSRISGTHSSKTRSIFFKEGVFVYDLLAK